MKSDIVDLTVIIMHQTDKAVRVADSEESEAVWLPLSQIEVEPVDRSNIAIVSMPEWLAQEKGLI